MSAKYSCEDLKKVVNKVADLVVAEIETLPNYGSMLDGEKAHAASSVVAAIAPKILKMMAEQKRDAVALALFTEGIDDMGSQGVSAMKGLVVTEWVLQGKSLSLEELKKGMN